MVDRNSARGRPARPKGFQCGDFAQQQTRCFVSLASEIHHWRHADAADISIKQGKIPNSHSGSLNSLSDCSATRVFLPLSHEWLERKLRLACIGMSSICFFGFAPHHCKCGQSFRLCHVCVFDPGKSVQAPEICKNQSDQGLLQGVLRTALLKDGHAQVAERFSVLGRQERRFGK